MHQLNVLVFGPSTFLSTLNELKPFLKFNHFTEISDLNYDIILFHDEILKGKKIKDYINQSNSLKVCVSNNINQTSNWDALIKLPTSLKEINSVVENTAAKKKFTKNSSIKVKDYLLNKNEKKLSNENHSIILTEKEIQLIELFLNSSKPISKENILQSVWNYSAEADTHTVETHIYRLRKKISEKFSDELFILNNKKGYYF